MAFDQIGLEAILEGVGDFISDGEALNDTVASMGGAFDAGASIISGAGDLIGGALGALGSAALELASAAGGALVDFFQDSFAGALEAEQTIARLGQVIESTGGVAGITVDEAEALADQFKNLAGGSDDAVISIIDMGLRMGTISEEEMPAFIQSTLDLGAVMGDAGKAAQLMARAQEDPVGVLGALRKAGILVNEETEAQIKAMVKAGDTAGAYSILMDRVGEATAGAAETMGETTAGQWAIFTETLADAGESIVGSLLPALNTLMQNVLVPLIPIVEEVAAGVGTFIETLIGGGSVGTAFDNLAASISRAFGPEAGLAVMQFGEFISGVVDTIITNWPQIQATIEQGWAVAQVVFQAISDFVINTLIPAIQQAVDWVIANWPMIQTKIQEVWAAIQPILQATVDFFINTLIPKFQEVVAWVIEHWPEIQAKIEEVMGIIQSVVTTVMNEVVPFFLEKFAEVKAWVDENWPLIESTIKTAIENVSTNIHNVVDPLVAFWNENHDAILETASRIWDTIKLNIDTAITLTLGIVKTAMQIFTGDWEGAWETIKLTASRIWDNMKESIDNSIHAIQTVIETVIGTLKTWWDTKWTEIKTKALTIAADMLAAFNTKVAEIKAAFTNIDWLAVGTSIIDGIKNGIAGAVGGLVNAAVQAALDAFNAARNALGISSPSTMFMEIGAETMEGLAVGIANETSTVISTVRESVGDVIDNVANTLTRARPVIERAAEGVGASITRGMGLQDVCNRVAREAEKIGSECLPAGLQRGLGLASRDISSIISRGFMPASGGATSTGSRSITPLPVSTQPVSTGGISAGTSSRQISTTYQYSPTYSTAPMSPERDFALMQVLAGI